MRQSTRFAQKIMLVTGAGQGISAGVARRAAAEGASLVLVDRSPIVRDIEKAITDMAELLEDCATYFDKRSDVIDGDYGASEPNEEMTMLTRIQRCLA